MAFIANTALAQWGSFQSQNDGAHSISADRGFLFIDNEYVPPPYEVKLGEDELIINGSGFPVDAFDLSTYRVSTKWRHSGMGGGRRGDWHHERSPMPSMGRGEWMDRGEWTGRGNWEGRGDGASSPEPPKRGGPNARKSDHSQDLKGERKATVKSDDTEAESAASQFALRQFYNNFEMLNQQAIIVLRSGAKPLIVNAPEMGYGLLKQLLAIPMDAQELAEAQYAIAEGADQETWQQLVNSFQATPVFIEHATCLVDEIDEAQRLVDAQVASVQFSERVSYPLTMFALILVVAGLGHLMASAHEVFSTALNRHETDELSKNIILLLVIMALMSAIDLIWTVMAHHSGAMRELNPIGSMLIDDTTKLIAFKFIVTGISIGLLFWQRRLPLSRKATWWCCLTMTLLTVRWLSFHSMLV
ncbi:hypothetical protein Poly21_14330 [Allorhodopirellula heiligendammensis]|uniref:DUF5658 domain-containing protein n=2 Tax=Allorhodopirellula heiligendammensis TaxID=2714739 RepID=A0A5C6C6Y8_9BACT|nr:hypothetical protein Poly21_14330 [Allorhodopirellula heiligendammensis]